MRISSNMSVVLLAFIGIILSGCDNKNSHSSVNLKTCDTTLWTVDANNWKMNLGRDGYWGQNPALLWGGYFRNGTVIFAGGIFVGAVKNGNPAVSSVHFISDFASGIISNTTVAAIEEMKISDANHACQYIIDQTESGEDWLHWPISLGAPMDGGGHPLLISAMDSWTVYHDADSSKRLYNGVAGILGVEVRQSTYMFVQSQYNGLEDVLFMHWRVTNKSNNDYSNAYIALWNDPDVNNGGARDLVASDTARNMIYVYNDSAAAVTKDVVGYQLLYFSGTNGINARPHATIWYHKTSDEGNDMTWQYNLMKGLKGDGTIRSDGDPNQPTFDFPGDPITKTGIIQTQAFDKQILSSVGPFTFTAGETHEIIFAIIGSEGTGRDDAIAKLRTSADNVKTVFKNQVAALLGL